MTTEEYYPQEVWFSPDGVRCYLHPYVPEPPDSEEWEPWYPEQPGMRPPQSYKMVRVDPPNTIEDDFTVFPVDPWSPYDAASDRLVREGWTFHEVVNA